MRDGGWFHTGDTCYRDGTATTIFCGRDDDMLKVGGIWVAPFEVESALAAHPGVLEAAVVGAEDENGLVKPKAFVALKDPGGAGPALESELVAFVRGRLAPFKYPRWIEFVDELPKNRVRQDPALPAARRIEEERDGRCLGLADEVRCGHAVDQHHRAAALRRDGAQGGDQSHFAHAHSRTTRSTRTRISTS